MALKPEHTLMIGATTAAMVYGIYQVELPNVASVRASAPNNIHIDASRKVATWTSAAVVAGVSLLAADPTIFIIGAGMIVIMDFSHRFANATHHMTGQIPGTGNAPALGG